MTSQRQSYKCSNMLEWFSNDWKFYYTSCYTVVWPKNPKKRFCFLKSLTIVVHILEYFSIFTELYSSMAVGLLTYLSIWNSVRHIHSPQKTYPQATIILGGILWLQLRCKKEGSRSLLKTLFKSSLYLFWKIHSILF